MEDILDLLKPGESTRERFGMLRIFVNFVEFESGAAYEIAGITDSDGNPWQLRGKKKVAKSRNRHIVFCMTQLNREGVEYNAVRDWVHWDKDYKNLVHPALLELLGDSNQAIGKPFPACIEEVETGETYTSNTTGEEVNKTAWVLQEVYPSDVEMRKAEQEFFSDFQDSDNTDTPTGWKPDGEGWTAESLAETADTIISELKDKNAETVAEEYGLAISDVLVAAGVHKTSGNPKKVADLYGVEPGHIAAVRNLVDQIPF